MHFRQYHTHCLHTCICEFTLTVDILWNTIKQQKENARRNYFIMHYAGLLSNWGLSLFCCAKSLGFFFVWEQNNIIMLQWRIGCHYSDLYMSSLFNHNLISFFIIIILSYFYSCLFKVMFFKESGEICCSNCGVLCGFETCLYYFLLIKEYILSITQTFSIKVKTTYYIHQCTKTNKGEQIYKQI